MDEKLYDLKMAALNHVVNLVQKGEIEVGQTIEKAKEFYQFLASSEDDNK